MDNSNASFHSICNDNSFYTASDKSLSSDKLSENFAKIKKTLASLLYKCPNYLQSFYWYLWLP